MSKINRNIDLNFEIPRQTSKIKRLPTQLKPNLNAGNSLNSTKNHKYISEQLSPEVSNTPLLPKI